MKIPNWAVGLEVTHAAEDRLRLEYTSGDLMIPRPPQPTPRRGESPPKRAVDRFHIKFEVTDGASLVFVEAHLDALDELPQSLHVTVRQCMDMSIKPVDVLISELRRRLLAAAAVEMLLAGESL